MKHTISSLSIICIILSTGLVAYIVGYRLCCEPKTTPTVNIVTQTAVVLVGRLTHKGGRSVRERNQVVNYDNSIRLDFRDNFEKYPCRVELILNYNVHKKYFIAKNDTVIKVAKDSVLEIRYFINDKLAASYLYGVDPRFWNISANIYRVDSIANDVKLVLYISNYALQPSEE